MIYDERSSKLIVTDVDGVLLDWNYAFTQWMRERGYKRKPTGHMYELESVYGISREEVSSLIAVYNLSASMAFIPPYKDAIKYVRKLHEEKGFIFHALTSMNDNAYANRLRRQNIRSLFGVTAFEKITCLPLGESKYDALSEYKDSGCFWIEDHVGNADVGDNLGMSPLIMAHPYNEKDHSHPRFDNWQGIWEAIT